MRAYPVRLLLAGAALLATAGCATSEEWSIWRENSAHFASLEHFKFSTRNRTGREPRVTRDDIQVARQQSWWGRAVTVSQEQILER